MVLAQPLHIAQAICDRWAGITQPRGASFEHRLNYLNSPGLPTNFAVMSWAFCRLLSVAIVLEAFKRINAYSSPGEDGMSTTIFFSIFSKVS